MDFLEFIATDIAVGIVFLTGMYLYAPCHDEDDDEADDIDMCF